jgi:hypothetical protein
MLPILPQHTRYTQSNDDCSLNRDILRNLRNCKVLWRRGNVVGIATGYALDDRGCRSSSPGRVKNFNFSMSSRPALGSTQSPVQWLAGDRSPGAKAART